MKKKIDTLFNSARQISLGEHEKNQLKEEFLAFTNTHPVSRKDAFWHTVSASLLTLRSPAPYVASLALIIVTGAGLTFASKNALPGDTLYPMKVAVSEELLGMLHRSPESNAIYEARRANERLEEIEQLALDGKIDASSWSELSAHVESHIMNVKEYISNGTGDIEEAHQVNSELQSVLDIHSDVLKKVSEELEQENDVVKMIISDINKKGEEVKSSQEKIIASIENNNSPELATLASSTSLAALDELQNINKTIKGQEATLASLSDKTTDPITTRLSQAKQNHASGTTAYENRKFGKAFVHYTRALQLLGEIEQLIETQKKLQMNTQDTTRQYSTSTSPTNIGTTTSSTTATSTIPSHKTSHDQTTSTTTNIGKRSATNTPSTSATSSRLTAEERTEQLIRGL